MAARPVTALVTPGVQSLLVKPVTPVAPYLNRVCPRVPSIVTQHLVGTRYQCTSIVNRLAPVPKGHFVIEFYVVDCMTVSSRSRCKGVTLPVVAFAASPVLAVISVLAAF